jgi:hypothetical protein
LGQFLASEVCVNATESAETAAAPPEPAKIGDDNLPVVSHDGNYDLTGAVNDDPDLSTYFGRKFCEETCNLRCYDDLRGDPAAIDPFKAFELIGLEAVGVTV